LPQNHLTDIQVANKKQKDNAAQDAEMKKRREDQAARDQENKAPEDTNETTDMLAAEDDEDVIF
jgi:V-type H+-transporting ATPase subunit D